MEKESQKRSLRDIIREKNPLNSASEFFNKKIKILMESLRNEDKAIRALVIGGKNDKALRDILKDVKSLFNKKEYINAYIVLDSFRERLGKASQKCSELRLDINTNYKEFFINELQGDEKEGLIEFREKLDKEIEGLGTRKAQMFINFKKEAGFLDFFRSIFTQRGRALRAWEKAHGKEIEKMKENLLVLMDIANETLNKVTEELKTMSYALAVRDVSSYSGASKRFTIVYQAFNNKFITFYKNHIKDLISDLTKDSLQEENTNVQRDTVVDEELSRSTIANTVIEARDRLTKLAKMV